MDHREYFLSMEPEHQMKVRHYAQRNRRMSRPNRRRDRNATKRWKNAFSKWEKRQPNDSERYLYATGQI